MDDTDRGETPGLHVLCFDSAQDALDYVKALDRHLAAGAGARDRQGVGRAIVWLCPQLRLSGFGAGCYLVASEAAVTAAREAGLSATDAGTLPLDELPEGRVLLIGEPADDTRARREERRGEDDLGAPF